MRRKNRESWSTGNRVRYEREDRTEKQMGEEKEVQSVGRRDRSTKRFCCLSGERNERRSPEKAHAPTAGNYTPIMSTGQCRD